MEIYRVRLSLISSLSTPWQADTIFGSLCWAFLRNYGEDRLREFLILYHSGEPPFILSNGFPGDLLPVPLSVYSVFPVHPGRQLNIETHEQMRTIKKLSFVKFEQFNEILHLRSFPLSDLEKEPIVDFTTLHSKINRITNTTGQEGSLYEVEEWALKTKYLSVYVKTTAHWRDKVLDLFELMSRVGFGKDKSTGKGHFKVLGMEQFNDFKIPDSPNGFVTLSNFIPARTDPTEGLYKTFVKYGKLGEEFSLEAVPFKKPLLMLSEGSVFCTGDAPLKDFYGRMVPNIAPPKPEVTQYALAFPIFLKYPSGQ